MVVITSTIVGILLFAAGSVGLTITWINHTAGSIPWIEGLLAFGSIAVLGLGIIVIVVLTPRDEG